MTDPTQGLLERISPFLFSLSPGFEQILLAEDHSSLVSDLVIMTLPKTWNIIDRVAGTFESSASKGSSVEPDRPIESAEKPGEQIKSFNRMTELLQRSLSDKPGKLTEAWEINRSKERYIVQDEVDEPDEWQIWMPDLVKERKAEQERRNYRLKLLAVALD
jgi:hypothetical protein